MNQSEFKDDVSEGSVCKIQEHPWSDEMSSIKLVGELMMTE